MMQQGKSTAQRRSICTFSGIAIGFRAFYAVLVDGAQMYGSSWLVILLSAALALPVVLALIALRKVEPQKSAADVLKNTVGRWGTRLSGLLLSAVLLYDSAAVLRLMNSTAKYVAMPEANSMIIMLATALTAVLAVLLGVSAAANAAVMWRRLLAVLIGILIITQMPYFKGAWLMPILGAGKRMIVREAIPAAGIFCFSVCGWLMMEPQHDKSGAAMAKMLVHTALLTAGIAMLFAMLIPGMIEEPPGRSFRIGRLLMNDRAGLSLEMPYVVLIYSGMLTMLQFELSAAAAGLELCFERLSRSRCVILSGVLTFAAAAAGIAEQEAVRMISQWYYPLLVLPTVFAGIRGLIRMRMAKKERAS